MKLSLKGRVTYTNYWSYELIFFLLLLREILVNSRATSSQILDRGPVYIKKSFGQQFFDPKRKQETDAVVIGYHIAIEECQTRFRWNRWNCTLPKTLLNAKRPMSLTKALPAANKETAYMYAMVAAGVTYSLMRSCARGENNRCPCVVERKRNKTQTTCKQNLDYSFRRAKKILKSIEVKQVSNPERRMFNIKNFKTGIKTIQRELPEVCNCHGLSGTCQQKSCWKSTPNIGKVSERLRELYDKAEHVRYSNEVKALVKTSNRRSRKKAISLRNSEIVYLEKSPDYCHSNLLTGHKGTLLRYCDTDNPKTCQDLCEGCGYKTVQSRAYERNCDKCRKQFTWCCTVSCGVCHVTKAQCMLPP